MAVQQKCTEHCFSPLVSHQDQPLPSNLQKSINAIIKKEGFISFTVIKEDILCDGGNYLAGLVSVDIKGETPEGNKELQIFYKLMKTEEKLTMVSVDDFYLTEVFVYTELTKVFQELQNEFYVPEAEKYKFVRSFGEACSADMIVLENMVKKGYTTPSRLAVMDLEYTRLAVKQLAKLHGLSFALQEKKPEYFNRKLRNMKHSFKFNESYDQFLHCVTEMVGSCVGDKYKRKLDEFTTTMMEKTCRYMEEDLRCLCHGDYRPNNIMMKIDNGKVTDLIPVDYQLLYYGCPVLDLLYFIYGCTDQQFRNNHLEELKSVYYENLEIFLEYFNVDVNLVYPRKEFEAHFSEKHDFGLISALLILPLMMTVDNNEIELADAGKKQVKFDDKFKDRMSCVLDDFIELGLL